MLSKSIDKTVLKDGELRSFKVKGFEILAINVQGKIYCLDGRCTHAGAPLAEGTLNGEILTCPWHYSQYNITTGVVVKGPAYKPLKTYAIQERENMVMIDI